MFQLKPIEHAAVSRALSKAERYRLLNEPQEAESICRDVLAVDPNNQDAMICLILAQTDLFAETNANPDEARSLASRLSGNYERAYYGGVIEERWAKALLEGNYPKETVFRFVSAAMECFEAADQSAPGGNDDAVLRWNACVRFIEREELRAELPETTDESEPFDEDVPVR